MADGAPVEKALRLPSGTRGLLGVITVAAESIEARDSSSRVNQVVARTLRKAAALIRGVLRSMTVLLVLAIAVAVADTLAIFLPNRDGDLARVGTIFVLACTLVPVLCFAYVRRRFAAMLVGVAEFASSLRTLATLPSTIVEGLDPLVEEAGRPMGVVQRVRFVVRFVGVLRESFGSAAGSVGSLSSVVAYGPRDVLAALYGVVSLVICAAAFPLLIVIGLVI